MDQRTINRAEFALEAASNAISALEQAETFRHSELAWTEFLIKSNRIYEYLLAGSKQDNRARPWVGTITNTLKTDPLMSYLQQARNADEHSLQCVKLPMEYVGGLPETPITTPGPLNVTQITIRISIEGALRDVTDERYGNTFQVPHEHNGTPLADRRPVTVAKLALRYWRSILSDAQRFVTNS